MSAVLQVVGVLLVAGGLWMQWPWLGVAAGGVGVVLIGVALELGRRSDAREPGQ